MTCTLCILRKGEYYCPLPQYYHVQGLEIPNPLTLFEIIISCT